MMNMMKRILSLTLALLLVVSYIPMPGHAEENEGETPQTCTQCGGELHGEGEVCPKQPCSEAGCYVTGSHENHEFCQVAGCDNIATAGHTEHTYCDEAECKLRTTEAHTQHKYCEESGCYAIGAHENHEFCQVAGCDNIATAGHTEHTYCDEAECKLRTSGAHTQHKYCSNDACTKSEPHTEGEGCFIPCKKLEECTLADGHEEEYCIASCGCPFVNTENLEENKHVKGCALNLYVAECDGTEECEATEHDATCKKFKVTDEATFQKAIAGGITEIVLEDSFTLNNKVTVPDGVTIDLNQKTLTVCVENSYYNNVTIKNGNIVLGKDDVHVCDGYFIVKEGKKLTLSNVNMTSPAGMKTFAVFHLKANADLELNGCNINVANNEYAGSVIYSGDLTPEVTVTNSTIVAENVGRGVANSSVVITNSDVTIKGTKENGLEHGFNGSNLTLNDSKLTISGGTGRGISVGRSGTSSLKVNGNSTIDISDMAEASIKIYNTSDTVVVAETATVTVDSPVVNSNNVVVTGGGAIVHPPKAVLNQGLYAEASGTPGEASYREAIKIDIYDVHAEEKLELKIYSGSTLLATTTLRETDRDDENVKLYPVNRNNDYFTANVVLEPTRKSGSWDTVWAEGVVLSNLNLPSKIEVYADGGLKDTYDGGITNDYLDAYYDFENVKYYVVESGDKYYESIQEAVNASETNNGTITVLADHTAEAVTIPEDKTVTIDLNSKTVKIPQILNKGALTIQNGTVEGTNPNKDTIRSEAGSLTLTNVKANGQRHVLRIVNGTATINGGEYTAQTAITGTRHALNVGDDESASNVAVVTVKGGKFVGPNGTTADSGAAVMVQKGSTVIIDGGDFSKGKNNVVSKDEGATLTITGGTFDQSVKNYIPATHKETEKDGIYTVAEKEKVASIGTKEYYTLQAAVDDAKGGETIKVLCDVDLTAPVVTDKKLMLNLNGKTIRNTTDIWNTANKDWSLISVQGGQLTITGNGKLIAKDNDCYAVDVRNGAQCVIQNGTFVGNISAVYVLKGNVYINGGEFSAVQKSEHDDYRFLLNLSDENRLDSNVVVQGGTFVGFNPENNLAEGENTNFCADGFKAKEVETGKWQVVEKDYVVQVGSGETAKTYESLAEAIADIEPSETATTITVLKDFEVDKDTGVTEIPAGKNIVINLNGKTVTMPGILNKGTLEVMGGTIVGNSFDYSVVENNGADAKLTVNFTAKSLRHGIRADGGVVSVQGGSYTVNGNGESSNFGLNASSGAKVTIAANAVFSGPYGESGTTNETNGAAVSARGEGTEVTIIGGVYSKGQNHTITVYDKAKLEIQNGVFTCTDGSAVHVGANGVATIANGTFTGNNGKALTVDEKGSLTITGGNYDEDPSDYIDEEKYCVGVTAGVYTVAEHKMTDVAGVPAQCDSDGYKAHKMCTNCGKRYVEENGKLVEKQAADLTIAKLGHSYKKVDAKAPTYTADGNREYYVCDNDCGKYFLKTAENTYEEADYDDDIKIPKLVSEDASGNPTVTPDVSDQIQGSDSDLVINLTDKDFVGTGNTDTDTVKILDAVLEELNGSLTVITYAGEVTFNKEAVAAMADAVTCEGVTIEVSSHDESVLNANQKSVLSAKNLKNKSKIIRVEVRDCAGNLLGGSTTANKGYGFGTNGKITIEVKKTISSGTKTSDYHAYWITDTKLVEESLAFATVGSDTYARITVTHLSDYVIGRAAKFTWSPATGDTSNIGLWIGVLGVSVVALGAVAIVVLKKKKK